MWEAKNGQRVPETRGGAIKHIAEVQKGLTVSVNASERAIYVENMWKNSKMNVRGWKWAVGPRNARWCCKTHCRSSKGLTASVNTSERAVDVENMWKHSKMNVRGWKWAVGPRNARWCSKTHYRSSKGLTASVNASERAIGVENMWKNTRKWMCKVENGRQVPEKRGGARKTRSRSSKGLTVSVNASERAIGVENMWKHSKMDVRGWKWAVGPRKARRCSKTCSRSSKGLTVSVNTLERAIDAENVWKDSKMNMRGWEWVPVGLGKARWCSEMPSWSLKEVDNILRCVGTSDRCWICVKEVDDEHERLRTNVRVHLDQ
jgi:hypothetical protein